MNGSAGRRDDRCPGVLRPHSAEDGALVRLRLPGGRTSGTTLRRLSQLAERHGNPDLQLTSRGSLQIRGLPPVLPDALVAAVVDLGLLPSPAHERVRNVAASPFSGLHGGCADLRDLAADLDRRLLAEPALAQLPGRFLFVLDDGRGDVSGLTFDLGYRALDEATGLILVGDPHRGVVVRAEQAAATLVALARDFLAVRGPTGAWHVSDLPGWQAEQLSSAVEAPPLGPLGVPLGAVGDVASVGVPLAMLTPAQADAVAAAAGDRTVIVTPWRGLVLLGAGAALPTLVDAGLVADQTSAWSRVSACVGAPGCRQGLVDTRALARELVANGGIRTRTHVTGCARGCGAPVGIDLIAPALELMPR